MADYIKTSNAPCALYIYIYIYISNMKIIYIFIHHKTCAVNSNYNKKE